jgi:ubiquinol-cytochrome c reductase iron-sulfur subunit
MKNGQHDGPPELHHRGLLALVCAWEMGKSAVKALAKMLSKPVITGDEMSRPVPGGRDEDLNLEPGGERGSHEAWGTLLVGWALLVALAGGVGFLIVYWNFGSNWLLGGTLALFWGGLGAALVLHARWLMVRNEATEPREQLASAPVERELAQQDFLTGAGQIRRRGLLAAIRITAGGVLTGMIVSLFRSMGSPPQPSLFSTIWKRGQRLTTSDGKPVSVDTLKPGSTMIVFPEDMIDDERAQTVLIRVPEADLRLPDSRSNWAPMGYIAYSRVCTHAGCPVGLYLATTKTLMCPCHQSTFDILRGARPTGGPAARPLPQLPLYTDGDGILRAAGGFTEPPGPGFWGMPS